MRFAFLLAPLLVLSALPAEAQTYLAQQCVLFGDAQYRRLDGSIERIAALEFPPPTIEKIDMKAGPQPVASVLTLRGRLTYRKRGPLETQFVCLLDATDKPLFFYALPVPATRGAPTPFGRGPGAAPPPSATTALAPQPVQRPPEPPRQPLPATAIRLRGLVRELGGKLQFSPCDGAPMALEDRTPGQELGRALRELTAGQEGRPMFVELYGGRETGPGGGIGALELRRAAVETAGCRERFDQREWIASGSEPSWRLEVTGRDMMLNVAGSPAPQRGAHGGLSRSPGAGVSYTATDDAGFVALFEERRCVDPLSGSLFAYTVEVRSEGRSYAGCAAHNPAMPAP
ncbi:hypothetical protein LJ725_01840 [Reyranella aquatilis]|uniref:Uncharacterized protein n=2 Tax=Reyranella aquatilis TaxID=2035356 RepID=A0ABS8KNM7_9HYPH|nr:hypothetical protein [Reyranella aquatilis]